MAGEGTGSGQSHTMVWSQRVERKEGTLQPASGLCSAPVPERVGPQGPAVIPAVGREGFRLPGGRAPFGNDSELLSRMGLGHLLPPRPTELNPDGHRGPAMWQAPCSSLKQSGDRSTVPGSLPSSKGDRPTHKEFDPPTPLGHKAGKLRMSWPIFTGQGTWRAVK